jgi:hypothetical protein
MKGMDGRMVKDIDFWLQTLKHWHVHGLVPYTHLKC